MQSGEGIQVGAGIRPRSKFFPMIQTNSKRNREREKEITEKLMKIKWNGKEKQFYVLLRTRAELDVRVRVL